MNVLPTDLRKQLERTVSCARDVAETAARAALEALAVHNHEPYPHMTPELRALRNKLRAHARQLGDQRDAGSGRQAIEHLVHECAYEHWHGMLFARFLAENHLLIESKMGIAISLEECEELAKEEGIDKWSLAAHFAHGMLPQVFRPDHPAFKVKFAREHRLKLESMLEGIPAGVFTASDSLGWVYQFWQSTRKTEVNRSEVKIGADELPAVTQLFTEPYMVQFLLDNALGAWWAVRRLSDSDLKEATTEDDLRRQASSPGIPLDFLRFVRSNDVVERIGPSSGGECTNPDENVHVQVGGGPSTASQSCTANIKRSPTKLERGHWQLAAGAFDDWPEHLGELKILDPCCGSGHFLVATFLMLVPMRMALENLTAHDAVDAVLRDNLHGLELDPRCVELAAFALAIAAWTYPGAAGYRQLPEMNLACSGLSLGVSKERWKELAAGNHNLRIALDWMHEEFREAPVLGSLLNPAASIAAKVVHPQELSKFLAEALNQETTNEQREIAVAAQGLARAASILSGQYHWVITNVPYLARGKQDKKLRTFCEQHYPAAKNELATVFLERCLKLCVEGGTTSLVMPQNWLFLTSYRKLREKLLKTETWNLLARFGPGAFETISGEVVKAILLTLSRANRASHSVGLFGEGNESSLMYGLDVSDFRTAGEKAKWLSRMEIKGVEQVQQLENPDARVALEEIAILESLGDYCSSIEGLTTGDLERFVSNFWEDGFIGGWEPYIQNVDLTTHYGGRTDRILWQDGIGILSRFPTAHNFPSKVMNGRQILGKTGLRITQMRKLPISVYTGEIFGKNGATVVPHVSSHLSAIWCFCSSPEYIEEVKRIDQALKVTNATLVKVPFDLEYWTKVAGEKYPDGLPRPYTDDPTQWIFHGHPCASVVWDKKGNRTAHGPRRTDDTVLQVAIARLLGYRWPAESNPGMELAEEQRERVRNCDSLLEYADQDGIVCISSVRGEPPAGERLLQLLAAAYGDFWDDGVLTRQLTSTGSSNLDDWLRNQFFDQHCKLFKHRPFVWHIWDGRRDGFHALVNYHKLAEGDGNGRRCLESLTYSYLGDWITRQQDGVKRVEGGAEDRLVSALELQKRLISILEGEPPFDLFVRWKPIEEQPIGWEPDINDGVRLNIRPFMADDIPGGKKGAGILRAKPNIKWNKDRGKEPLREQDQFPWFWRNGEFTGERINEIHFTSIEKRTARNGRR